MISRLKFFFKKTLASNGELKIVGFRLEIFLKNHKSIQTLSIILKSLFILYSIKRNFP